MRTVFSLIVNLRFKRHVELNWDRRHSDEDHRRILLSLSVVENSRSRRGGEEGGGGRIGEEGRSGRGCPKSRGGGDGEEGRGGCSGQESRSRRRGEEGRGRCCSTTGRGGVNHAEGRVRCTRSGDQAMYADRFIHRLLPKRAEAEVEAKRVDAESIVKGTEIGTATNLKKAELEAGTRRFEAQANRQGCSDQKGVSLSASEEGRG